MTNLARKLWTNPGVAVGLLIAVCPALLVFSFYLVPKEARIFGATHEEIAGAVRGETLVLGSDGVARGSGNYPPLGWWLISYPVSLLPTDHKPIKVKYVAAEDWNSRPWPTKLSVSVSAVGLEILPKPLNYDFFDVFRSGDGQETHVWTVSPNKSGSYTIVFNFSVEPKDYFLTTDAGLEVNNGLFKTNIIPNEYPGETTVLTKFGIPILWLDILQVIAWILSFIVTLPAFNLVIRHYLSKPVATGLFSSQSFDVASGFPPAKMSESIGDNPNRRLSHAGIAAGGFVHHPRPSSRRRQAVRSGHGVAVRHSQHGRGGQLLPTNA